MGRLRRGRFTRGVRRDCYVGHVSLVDAIERIQRIEDGDAGQRVGTREENCRCRCAGDCGLKDTIPFDDDFGILSQRSTRDHENRDERKHCRDPFLVCAHVTSPSYVL